MADNHSLKSDEDDELRARLQAAARVLAEPYERAGTVVDVSRLSVDGGGQRRTRLVRAAALSVTAAAALVFAVFITSSNRDERPVLRPVADVGTPAATTREQDVDDSKQLIAALEQQVRELERERSALELELARFESWQTASRAAALREEAESVRLRTAARMFALAEESGGLLSRPTVDRLRAASELILAE